MAIEPEKKEKKRAAGRAGERRFIIFSRPEDLRLPDTRKKTW